MTLKFGFVGAIKWNQIQPRPREYRASSWSWASVDGTVECFADTDVDPDLRLLSYEVTPAQPTAQHGALDAGYIEILGRMRRTLWIDDRQTFVDVETGDAVNGEALVYTRADTDEDVNTAPIFVWCLQICPYDLILDEGHFGLILTTEDERVFQGVGMFLSTQLYTKARNLASMISTGRNSRSGLTGPSCEKLLLSRIIK